MNTMKFAAVPISLFGYESRKDLGVLLKRENVKKALIVTDRVLVELGICDKVCEVLNDVDISYVVYSDVTVNPTLENVDGGIRLFEEMNCDFIVAVGGGSANDCAKGIKVLAAGGGHLKEYEGGNKSKGKGPFLVAVNTTAGTGSEVSRAYLISDEAQKRKLIFKDDFAMPSIAVNDTELMVGLPEAITAQTGMDALTHGIESYLSTSRFLLTDILAKDAIDLIYRFLPVACSEPDNIEARDAMAYGQYLAGLSFGSAGLGLIHAMAHQLGATYHLPHGLCNAILLPYVLEFDQVACRDRLADMARIWEPEACMGKDEAQQAALAVELVKALSKKVKTNVPIGALGVKEEDFDILAEKSLQDGCINSAPVIPDKAQIIELFRKAL